MIKTAETYHVPVLLKESVDGSEHTARRHLCRRNLRWWRTLQEILSRLTDGAHLYSFDQDADAEQQRGGQTRTSPSYAPTSDS